MRLVAVIFACLILGVFSYPVPLEERFQRIIDADEEQLAEHTEKILDSADSLDSYMSELNESIETAVQSNGPICWLCKKAMGRLGQSAARGDQSLFLKVVSMGACKLITYRQYSEPTFCKRVLDLWRPLVMNILSERLSDSEDICTIMHACDSPRKLIDRDQWINSVLNDAPAGPIQKLGPLPEDEPVARFVQISDPHIDYMYAEGSATECELPNCCHAGLKGKGVALPLGNYTCDANERLSFSFKPIVNDMKPDFVVISGDVTDHDWMEYTKEQHVEFISKYYKQMKETFGDIPVYPCMGNHEARPVDNFSPFKDKYILDTLADAFAPWLPQSAVDSVRHGGYYSVMINDKIKLINLNTQYGDVVNMYTMLYTDPLGQMEWLRNELRDAEAKQLRVLMQYHIPSPLMNRHVATMLQALMQRYGHVVMAHLTGHTHADSFSLFRGMNGKDVTSVTLISPSLSPLDERNPSMRLYSYLPKSGRLVDYFQMRVDLDESERDHKYEARWLPAYRASVLYGLKSIEPQEYAKFFERMQNDPSLFQKWFANYEFRKHRKCEDASCVRHYMCSIGQPLWDESCPVDPAKTLNVLHKFQLKITQYR